MKLKNAAVVAAALALAVGMTACGSSSSSTAASSTASSVTSSVAASSEAASSEAASSEAAVEPAEYTVYNTTGSTVSELYLYVAGSEDKGENLAGEGLADGENVVLTLPEDASPCPQNPSARRRSRPSPAGNARPRSRCSSGSS